MARNKIPTTVYVTEDQLNLLKLLSDRTKVPVAAYIREGIDLILKRHEKDLPGRQLTLVDEEEDKR